MILVVVLTIYCWVEIVMSDPRQVRQLPRGLWAVIVIAPVIGPFMWLVYGRPNGSAPRPVTPRPKPRVVAPDDDPDFLRSLKPPPVPPDD